MEKIYEEARELSNRFNSRYYILANGSLQVAGYDESVPEGTIAYTWYRTRSKQANKWTIQEVAK